MICTIAACWALTGATLVTPPVLKIQEPTIKVKVNDRDVTFPDAGPRRIGGRVMIPLRGVFEAMGAELEWLSAEQKVVATKGARKVNIVVGEGFADVNGVQVKLDQPPKMIEQRVFVPLRFLGESLGATVDWDGATQTVNVKAPPVW